MTGREKLCDWCDQPATITLIIEPAVYEVKQAVKIEYGKRLRHAVRTLKKAELTAVACEKHAHPFTRNTLAEKRRRRKDAREWAKQQETLI